MNTEQRVTGGNFPPNIIEPLKPIEINEGDTVSIDLLTVFEDPDGDTMTFSVSEIYHPNRTIGVINGNSLDINPEVGLHAGNYIFVITADDGNGHTTSLRFFVTVLAVETDFIGWLGDIFTFSVAYIVRETQDFYETYDFVYFGDMTVSALARHTLSLSGKTKIISKKTIENSPNLVIFN